MRRNWIWAILMVALLLVTACRPAVENLGSEESEQIAAELLGACKPEEECDDETAVEEEPVEETAEPTAVPEAESRPEEAENAPTDAAPSLGDDPLAITDGDWVKGPDDALFTLVEYGDFQ